MFDHCSSLYRLVLSKWRVFGAASTTNTDRNWIGNNPLLTRLILPSVTAYNAISNATTNLTMIDLGPNHSSSTNASSVNRSYPSTAIMVARATTPVSLGTSVTVGVKKLFVPAESVDLYKEAARWSARASVTYAIGGAEWIAEFGSADEYANLTEQEYADTYGWLAEQE